MYLQTTSTRRANEVLGTGVRGALVHIAHDPRAAVIRMTREPVPTPTGNPATDGRLAAEHEARLGRARAALVKLDAAAADWARPEHVRPPDRR